MNTHPITLCGVDLCALGSGALFWPAEGLLCVSDLHLGKSDRIARRSGAQFPPYEVRDTLLRLEADIEATGARRILCLGDSFDDADAVNALSGDDAMWLARLQAGRDWLWVEGNHDPGPIGIGGTHLAHLRLGPLVFRHIADPATHGEVSGHYHPKATVAARGRSITRACFLVDCERLVMPAYGTYTGGLRSHDPVLCALMRDDALAILTGPVPRPVPMPRKRGSSR
ncbi:MAG: ligase-associated DNA damage response endonuclease PdeM [Pseudooceanicola sp.]